jgi:phospholipid N-methyltransferase
VPWQEKEQTMNKVDLKKELQDHVIFLREGLQTFKSTGSICSSSRWAALEMTAPLRASKKRAKKILEVGPGTGVITFQILRDMGPDDQLTICEINPRFMDALKKRLEFLPEFKLHEDRVSFFCGPVQELDAGIKFDFILSAIPFLNLDLHLVKAIFDKYRELSTGQTTLTYYEYMGLRKLNLVLPLKSRRTRVQRIHEYLKGISSSISYAKSRVWRNLLPINVYQVQPANLPA